MKKKQRVKIKREIKDFSNYFVEHLSKLLVSFERVQPDIKKAIPDVFSSTNIAINTYFSKNRRHVMILFEDGDNANFNFTMTENNVFDILDETGLWEKQEGAAFCFENSSGIVSSCSVMGAKPFEIIGEKNKITFSNLIFSLPNGRPKRIPFGYIFSYPVFKKIFENIDDHIENMIYTYWDYYRNNKQKISSPADAEKQKQHIKDLLIEMEKLFFDAQIEEKIIDNFITENPIILEKCLRIKPDSLLPQPTLKNWVQENFKQDMKPDLICQNIHDDWVILDYKRAKKIIKKNGTARADVTSDVHELHTQIKNYRKYFSEEKHRDSFFKNTGHKISNPQGIGVIGYLADENERKIFLDQIEDFPNWIQIISYTEMYEIFKQFYDDLS